MTRPPLTEADLPPALAAMSAAVRASVVADANRRRDEAPTPSRESVETLRRLIQEAERADTGSAA